MVLSLRQGQVYDLHPPWVPAASVSQSHLNDRGGGGGVSPCVLPSQLSQGGRGQSNGAREPFRKSAKLYKPSVFSLVLSLVISVDS